MNSWKTTVAGICAALGLALPQIGHWLSGNGTPEWSVVVGAVTSILGLLGVGVFARDNNVTSEQAGAK